MDVVAVIKSLTERRVHGKSTGDRRQNSAARCHGTDGHHVVRAGVSNVWLGDDLAEHGGDVSVVEAQIPAYEGTGGVRGAGTPHQQGGAQQEHPAGSSPSRRKRCQRRDAPQAKGKPRIGPSAQHHAEDK